MMSVPPEIDWSWNRLDVLAHPVELRVVEHRAGRHHRAQGVEVELLARHEAGVLAHLQVGGARAEHGHALVGDEPPQRVDCR